MHSAETISTLRLIRSENVGPKTFFSLIKAFGSAVHALAKVEEFSSHGRLASNIKLCPHDEVIKEIELATAFGAEIICCTNDRYPALLKEISNYPPVITIAGPAKHLLQSRCVAIVGSRNPSINGNNFAHKIATELAESDYTIVSGFARGIDTYAHMGSLAHGTIAVTACGINHIYPPENKKLYQDILNKGLILTEQAFNSLPKAVYFPQRNRIIAGLSLATVVIEAGIKSGSLITANFALEQNREVFATPGFPLDYRYSGTNHLIKQGAYLLEKTEDILTVLNQQCIPTSKARSASFDTALCDPDTSVPHIENAEVQKDLDRIRKLVLDKIGTMPITFDQLIRSIGAPSNLLAVALVELELEGKLERVGSNQFLLIS